MTTNTYKVPICKKMNCKIRKTIMTSYIMQNKNTHLIFLCSEYMMRYDTGVKIAIFLKNPSQNDALIDVHLPHRP